MTGHFLDSEFAPFLEGVEIPDMRSPEQVRKRVSQIGTRAPGDPISANAGPTLTVFERDLTVDEAGSARDVRVRVYSPRAETAPIPGVVFFHGGGFIAGDLDTDDIICASLCEHAPAVVISVDYRLAPEFPFPAGVEDCYSVLCHVSKHADEYGIDPAFIGVCGASAGGNLAAAVSLMARDRSGPALAFQMMLYAAVDFSMTTPSSKWTDTPSLDGPSTAFLHQHYLSGSDGPNAYASPALATSTDGLPPAYVLVSGIDPLRDEALDYARRLLDSGIPVELHVMAGVPHGVEHYPTRAATHALAEEALFVQRIRTAVRWPLRSSVVS